jgi:hypothetical protein
LVYSEHPVQEPGNGEQGDDAGHLGEDEQGILVKFLVYSVVVGLQLSSWFTVYLLYRSLLMGSEEIMQDISERMSKEFYSLLFGLQCSSWFIV